MITSLSLNPSIDLTISIGQFTYGGLNRVKSDRQDAGGKGLNVALVLRRLGCEAECVGFLQEQSAALFESTLKQHGAGYEFVYCPGSVRTNVKMRDDSTRQITELNQSGRPVTQEQVAAMTAMVKRHAASSSHLVLTGSIPPGCGAGYYRELMEEVRGTGCRCVLDADGERLREGLKANPYLIKPNRYELELLTGRKTETVAEVRAAALDLIEDGVQVVAVSLGGDGAFITDGTECLYAPGLKIAVNSTVGAGDSMIAALTASLSKGENLETTFRSAVASATAACMTEGTTLYTEESYRGLLSKVEIEHV